jgi:hypothetical protein
MTKNTCFVGPDRIFRKTVELRTYREHQGRLVYEISIARSYDYLKMPA